VLRRPEAARKERLGVVLKVNGENTLFRQRREDLLCTKWILEPGTGDVSIAGFQQKDRETALPFTVRTPEESKEGEVNYDEDKVGTITLVVYREKKAGGGKGEGDDDTLLFSTRGEPKPGAKTVDALRQRLAGTRVRGLIEAGGTAIASKVTPVTFVPDPEPWMAATVVYYSRKGPAASSKKR
jgi:hypothetical protein